MILIYGGNGFIGQHVARYLLDAGERVVVTTNSRPTAPQLLSDAIADRRVVVEQMDMTDAFAVMSVVSKHRPRMVIDASGYRPKAFAPGRDVSLRIGALVNILEAARLNETSRVVLLSSMDAYWGLSRDHIPYREDMNVPLLEQGDNFIVQSWVKKSLEVIGNLYRRQSRMDIAFVRASGVYGPLYRTFMNVPSRLVRAAVRGIDGFGEQQGGIPFGEDGYDQVYVKDLARGIGLVALAPKLQHPVYNIGSGCAPTYAEFARAVERVVPSFKMELRSRSRVLDAPDNGMNGVWMDISRAREELGYAPSYSVDAAIADYVDWMREHAE